MNRDDHPERILNRRPLVAGALLASIGGIVTFVGVLISVLTTAAAARRWVRQLDHGPAQAARVKWQQVRAAGAAGAGAWKGTTSD